jgi:adenine-specific DNA-methyltransferase
LKYLLALLNSKLGEYWFNTNGKKRGVGVDIGVKVFRQFPVKIAAEGIQKSLVNLVDKALGLKEDNIDSETIGIENEIDKIVFELYGLTEDEKKNNRRSQRLKPYTFAIRYSNHISPKLQKSMP